MNVDQVDEVDVVDNVNFSLPRQVFVRNNYFDSLSNDQFFKRFRLTKESTLEVLSKIEGRLEYVQDKNNSISPINQLLLTLRVYATGGHLLSIGDFINCDKSTISRLLLKVTEAIASLSKEYTYMPKNANKIAQAQSDFFELAQFPKVIGAIDGCHVKIQSPGGNKAESYRNRKGYFSINVQGIASADLLFLDVVALWPGSAHDATIFNNSKINYIFESGQFGDGILLGDSAYMNKSFLMTPFLRPQSNGEIQFNKSHVRTRVKVENIFGIWKRRFPIMAYGCRLKLQTAQYVVIATAVLHNIARRRGEPEPPLDEDIQTHIENGNIPIFFNEENNFDNRRYLVDNYFSRM